VTASNGESRDRIPPGRFRDLGPINWLIATLGARTIQVQQMHLFTTLGQHRLLFLAWAFYGARLLSKGRLTAQDTELVILRVAHLRGSDYELEHHGKLGRRRGVGDDVQSMIFAWPAAATALDDNGRGAALTERQHALLEATDEFVVDRAISDAAWQRLSRHLDRRQLIEFCMLAGHYDALAATIASLAIPLDRPR
jgi:alkylhydroperoxidase family enzyme